MKRFGTYALVCIGLLAVAVGLWKAREDRLVPLEYLPSTDTTLVNVDFHALRQTGILSMLAGKPGIEEPEYREFIRATGFDYQKDLESATVAFGPDATYFLVRGRFNWDKLESYAKANGGSCYDRLCHFPGSRPERRISFVPLRNNVMALAVSPDDLAAARLTHPVSGRPIEAPKDPVWVSIPASALKRTALLPGGMPGGMPAGARLFAAAVSGADRVTLTLGPKDGGEYSARLEAVCASTKDAQAIAAQLSKVTSTLKEAASNGKASGDLAGLLVAGTFQQSDKKVFGYWPIRKGLLENLAGGI